MRNMIVYETQHGSAKKLAGALSMKMGSRYVTADTPFQAEDADRYDNLVLIFGFRGPYTAQLIKLFLQRMEGRLTDKNLVVIGVGLFSDKEFPAVAEEIRALARPKSFSARFMRGQLRVSTLTLEERAMLDKFSELTGMPIEDMGEYSYEDAERIAAEVKAELEALDPHATGKWVCTVCGKVCAGEEPPERCPVCNQPAEAFKRA